MVTIAAPLRSSKAVPHTTAVSAVAVLRSEVADAMFPIKVVVPWEHVADVSRVRLTVCIPDGFSGEIVLVEPSYVLAETRLAPASETSTGGPHIRIAIEAEIETSGADFACGAKFPDDSGSLAAVVGITGERLTFEATARLYRR